MTGKPTPIAHGEDTLIRVPMRFKKRCGRKEIIAPEGLDAALPANAPAQEALVVALARAHRWQQTLDAGGVDSITELAGRLDVDSSYVGRVLRLTLLAPYIIQAVLAGREPSGLSLAKLTKTLPFLWNEQRELFGLPPT